MVKSIQQLSLDELHPEIPGRINLNTRGDPDCGNFGVRPSDVPGAFRGRNANKRRLAASASNAAISAGVGRYTLGTPGDKNLERFDESALFSSAVSQLRLFAAKADDVVSRSAGPMDPATRQVIYDARQKADSMEMLGGRYFNFGAAERAGRNAFTGIMTRRTYTKAAHLACLKEMLPDGRITLVGDREAARSTQKLERAFAGGPPRPFARAVPLRPGASRTSSMAKSFPGQAPTARPQMIQ